MTYRLKNVLKNPYIFSILSKVVVVLVGLLFTMAQARYLGAEIKGQISYVTSITSITSIVLGFGMHQAYPYYKKISDEDILQMFLKLAMIQFAFYTLISVIIALIFSDIKLIAIIIVTPIMVYNKTVSYITMIEIPNKKNTVEMIINIAELIFVVALWIILPASFLVGLIIIVFKDIVMALIYSVQWRKRVFGNKSSLKGWLVRLIKFGAFPMLALLMTTLNYRVDVIMLEGKVVDAQIGVYSIGVMLAERIWLIPDAMKEVMVSKVAKGKGIQEVAFVIRICNTVCLIVALCLVCLGYPFIRLFFGKEYSSSYQITLILLIGVFFMIYYKMIASYNIVIGKQIVNFIFLGISVVGNIISNYLLIPKYGIYGAGIASVVSYGICSVLFLTHFIKTAKIPFYNMILAKPSDIKSLKYKFHKEN